MFKMEYTKMIYDIEVVGFDYRDSVNQFASPL